MPQNENDISVTIASCSPTCPRGSGIERNSEKTAQRARHFSENRRSKGVREKFRVCLERGLRFNCRSMVITRSVLTKRVKNSATNSGQLQI